MEDIIIQKINEHTIGYIKDCIQQMGSASKSFRYYETRLPEEVIPDHLLTIVLLKPILEYEYSPIGYGHLDREGDTIWLGICVKEAEQGKGYGRMIMGELTSSYSGDISLTVDKDNVGAIKLYKDFSFEQVEDRGDMIKMVREAS